TSGYKIHIDTATTEKNNHQVGYSRDAAFGANARKPLWRESIEGRRQAKETKPAASSSRAANHAEHGVLGTGRSRSERRAPRSFRVSAQRRRDGERMQLAEAALGRREDARFAEARCRPTQPVAVAIAKPISIATKLPRL